MIKSDLAYQLYEAGVIPYDDFSSIESRPNELVDAIFRAAVDIEAKAGRKGFIDGAEYFIDPDKVNLASVAAAADNYAATLRQGGDQ